MTKGVCILSVKIIINEPSYNSIMNYPSKSFPSHGMTPDIKRDFAVVTYLCFMCRINVSTFDMVVTAPLEMLFSFQFYDFFSAKIVSLR